MPKQIKLPRKRKKAYIKARGANNYRGMRHFLRMEGEYRFPKNVAMSPNSTTGMPDFAVVGGNW